MARNFSVTSLDICSLCGKSDISSLDETILAYDLPVVPKRHLCYSCAEKRGNSNKAKEKTAIAAETKTDWPCNHHGHETVNLFCAKCRKGICQVCAFTEHSGHTFVPICEAADNVKRTLRHSLGEVEVVGNEVKRKSTSFSECDANIAAHFQRLKNEIQHVKGTELKRIEDTRCTTVDRTKKVADEEILRVVAKRDASLKKINEIADRQSQEIKNSRDDLLDQLDGIHQVLRAEIKQYRAQIKRAGTIVSEARKFVMTALAKDDANELICTASEEQKAKLTLANSLSNKLPVVDVMMRTLKVVGSVKFDREHQCGQIVGKVDTATRPWKLTNKLHLPSSMSDSILLGALDEHRVVVATDFWNEPSFYAVKLDGGDAMLLIKQNVELSGIVDFTAIDDGKIALSYHSGNIWLCSNQGEHVRKLSIPSKVSSQNNISITVDQRGMLLTGERDTGEIKEIDPTSGRTVKSTTVPGKKIHSLHVMESGKRVIRSSDVEVNVLDPSGAVDVTICESDWRMVKCAVGNDNMVVVSYLKTGDDDTVYVDMYSHTGSVIQSVGKFPRKQGLLYPELAVTPSGRVVVLSTNEIYVYQKPPLAEKPISADMIRDYLHRTSVK